MVIPTYNHYSKCPYHLIFVYRPPKSRRFHRFKELKTKGGKHKRTCISWSKRGRSRFPGTVYEYSKWVVTISYYIILYHVSHEISYHYHPVLLWVINRPLANAQKKRQECHRTKLDGENKENFTSKHEGGMQFFSFGSKPTTS